MKRIIIKIISVFLIVVVLLTSAPLSGFLNINTPKLFDLSVKAEANTLALSDEMAQKFIDLFYDTGSSVAEEVKAVLIGEQTGSFETYKDIFEKIESFFNVIGDSGISDNFSSSAATQVLDGTLKIVDIVGGCIDIYENSSSFLNSDNSLQKTVDGFQIFQGVMSVLGYSQYFPSSLGLILTSAEVGMSIAGYLEKQYIREAIELYKAELYIAYYTDAELPLPPTANVSGWGVSQEQADSMYAQVYLDFVIKRMLDNIGRGTTEDSSSSEDFYESESLPINMAMNMTITRTFSIDGYTTKYSSSDTSIATVDSNTGKITPVKVGTAYIIADIAGQARNRVKITIYPFDVRKINNNSEYEIYSCSEDVEGVLELPIKVGSLPLTSIADRSFMDCNKLTTLVVSDVVTNIDAHAFIYCDSLTNIEVSEFNNYFTSNDGVLYNNEMTEIIKYPCGRAGTEFTISNGIISIGNSAFSHCNNLVSVFIGNSVTTIGEFAFDSCASLTNVTIGDNVTTIGDFAFSSCDALKNVTIGDSVTTVGSFGFSSNNIENVYIDSFENWCNISFENGFASPMRYASNLYINNSIISGDFTVPSGVSQIPAYTFKNSQITSISIPSSVSVIGEGAFYYCTELADISISDGLKTISEDAFWSCYSISEVLIPKSVTTIEKSAFDFCNSLENIIVSSDNQTYSSVNGVLFNKNKTNIILYPKGKKSTSYTIPNTVVTIEDYALYSCDNLTNVIIPDSVTSIGEDSFGSCNSLESIQIGSNVKTIGESAFYYCNSLLSVTIPNSVTTIGKSAFSQCFNLVDLTLGNGIITIGDYAFWRCSAIKEVTIPGNVTSIGDNAFYACYSLTSITFPSNITTIGYYSFAYCDSLCSIILPESINSIDDGAFYDCTSLTDVYYFGTQSQWANIVIGDDNESLTNATLHCSYIPHEHSYTGTITKEPSCEETGEKKHICSCGDFYIEELSAVGHTHKLIESVAPTCTESGLTEGSICFTCGKTLNMQETIPATGHNYENGVCTICGETMLLIFNNDDMHIEGLIYKLNDVNEFINQVGIDNANIEIYNSTGALITENELVGTGANVYIYDKATNELVNNYTVVLYGDVNGDGLIDAFDKEIITSMALCKVTIENEWFLMAADVNHDGAVDAFDVIETELQTLDMTNIEQKNNSACILTNDEDDITV